MEVGRDGLPGLVPLTKEKPQALVTVISAMSHQLPGWSVRDIPLDVRVVEGEDSSSVTASAGVIDAPHQLYVLLRHLCRVSPSAPDAVRAMELGGLEPSTSWVR